MSLDVVGTSAYVRLNLESRAEDIARVRKVVSALGQAAHLEREQIADVQTAVSEACNNVVMHAYGAETGPMLITLVASAGHVSASIHDDGGGIGRTAALDGGLGLGLGVMGNLADRLEVITSAQGTDVKMCFARDGRDRPDTEGRDRPDADGRDRPDTEGRDRRDADGRDRPDTALAGDRRPSSRRSRR